MTLAWERARVAGVERHPPKRKGSDEGGEPPAQRSTASPRRSSPEADVALALALSPPLPSGGRPVAPSLRAPVEAQLGVDLAEARLHDGPAAAKLAGEAGARAITAGRDVVLGPGESGDGRRSQDLIAHELAHVAQWKAAPGVRPGWSSPGDPHERHAAAVAHDVASGAAPTAGPMPVGRVPAASRQQAGQPAATTTTTPTTTTPTATTPTTTTPTAAATPTTPPTTPPPVPLTPDQEIVAVAQAPAAGEAAFRPSMNAFNLIMRNRFPGPSAHWFRGTSFDAGETNVSADTAGGTNGGVMFVLGTQFARDTTAATLEARVADVRRVLVQVLHWRMNQGILTAGDIAIPLVHDELRITPAAELRRVRGLPTVEPAAREAIDRLLISTPLPGGAQLGASGSATLTINGMSVEILPDTSGGTTNETAFRLVPDTVLTPGFNEVGGTVREITGPMPAVPALVIQTSYAATGPQAGTHPNTGQSAYGRGTTTADVASGNTTLRFHEGSHGTDFLDYLRAHPYRGFRGRVGMTIAQWNTEVTAFFAARTAWVDGMNNFSLCRTDCVGARTIDDEHSGESGYQLQCTGCRP